MNDVYIWHERGMNLVVSLYGAASFSPEQSWGCHFSSQGNSLFTLLSCSAVETCQYDLNYGFQLKTMSVPFPVGSHNLSCSWKFFYLCVIFDWQPPGSHLVDIHKRYNQWITIVSSVSSPLYRSTSLASSPSVQNKVLPCPSSDSTDNPDTRWNCLNLLFHLPHSLGLSKRKVLGNWVSSHSCTDSNAMYE